MWYSISCSYICVCVRKYIWNTLRICMFVHACTELLALPVGDGEAVPLVFCLVFKEYLIHACWMRKTFWGSGLLVSWGQVISCIPERGRFQVYLTVEHWKYIQNIWYISVTEHSDHLGPQLCTVEELYRFTSSGKTSQNVVRNPIFALPLLLES